MVHVKIKRLMFSTNKHLDGNPTDVWITDFTRVFASETVLIRVIEKWNRLGQLGQHQYIYAIMETRSIVVGEEGGHEIIHTIEEA